jgi:neutral/alkaline ceramidase-like enzyme
MPAAHCFARLVDLAHPFQRLTAMHSARPACSIAIRFGLLLLALLSALLAASGGRARAAEKVFRAGAFAADITPLDFPISVNGGMADRQATGAHDPLHARCLVLDNGTTQIAIVVCDSCMIPRELLDAAKRLASKATGLREDHILVSATHTHEAPTLGPVFQSEPNKAYLQFFVEQLAKGIQQAHKQLEPARIGWAVGTNRDQVFNRRWKMKPGTVPPGPFAKTTDLVKMNPGIKNPGLIEPAGEVDPDVTVISVQAVDGRPIAVLANYGLHYVGGVEPLSADYFGEFAEQMKRRLRAEQVSPAFVGIMSNGTSGDVNNVNFAGEPLPRRAQFEQIQIVATSVAETAYEAMAKIEYQTWVPIEMRERELELGVRLPTPEDVSDAKAVIAQAKKPVLSGLREVYAGETVQMAKYPSTVPCKVQALRIGGLGIVTTPCETFVEIGQAIKRASPLKPTIVIELANGYNGYLPTPEQHKLGGYETWRARSSYLESDASTKITATLIELLKEVAR